MLKNFVKIFGGDPNKKTIEQYSGIAKEINALEPQFESLSDEALRAKTDEFKSRILEIMGNVEGLDEKEQFKAEQDALNEILPEAFAAVRTEADLLELRGRIRARLLDLLGGLPAASIRTSSETIPPLPEVSQTDDLPALAPDPAQDECATCARLLVEGFDRVRAEGGRDGRVLPEL